VEHDRARRATAPIKVWVNGDLVNDASTAPRDRGRIALQAEGSEVEFRRVEIGPLPPAAK
jgi:hypothetical protein